MILGRLLRPSYPALQANMLMLTGNLISFEAEAVCVCVCMLIRAGSWSVLGQQPQLLRHPPATFTIKQIDFEAMIKEHE